jgi:hypothetical protein
METLQRENDVSKLCTAMQSLNGDFKYFADKMDDGAKEVVKHAAQRHSMQSVSLSHLTA